MTVESASPAEAKRIAEAIMSEVGKVVVGKQREIKLILATMVSEGHVLLEGVPGVAKTTIAKSIASVLGLKFSRIQFTPDMLPSDVLGTFIFDRSTGEFKFRPGPIFANIVLADEINRASPRTQSAFLEAMQERQVTLEGRVFKLDRPFIVIATMNPVEMEGIYPLPEAQLDRFMTKIELGYPSKEEEVEILKRQEAIEEWPLRRVAGKEEILSLIEGVKRVHVSEPILDYIAEIVRATRIHPRVRLGASPRAAVAILKLSRSLAYLDGRSYVTPDDVKSAVKPVLLHRIILKHGTDPRVVDQLIDDILSTIATPSPPAFP
ncbi:MAG: MoxR family ATPase [Desulfurococcales archaeon]|nr:MoxR family ATPase [Desulfurococcales archaeon]